MMAAYRNRIALRLHNAFTEACASFDSSQFDPTVIDDDEPRQVMRSLHIATIANVATDNYVEKSAYKIYGDAAFENAEVLVLVAASRARSFGYTDRREIGGLLLASKGSLTLPAGLDTMANAKLLAELKPDDMTISSMATPPIDWSLELAGFIAANPAVDMHRCPASFLQVRGDDESQLMIEAFWENLVTLAYCPPQY